MTSPSPAEAGKADSDEAVHHRIADRLAAMAATANTDTPPHPYVRHHLVQHAALGHVLDDTHLSADFLPWEESGGVRGQLGLPVSERADRRRLAAWAGIEPFLTGDHRSRASSLDQALAAAGADHGGSGSAIVPLATHWKPANHDILSHEPSPITKIEDVPGPDGRPLLAVCGEDGTVKMWDPATGALTGQPIAAHAGPVTAVVSFRGPSGRWLLATGGADGSVCAWEPATSTPLGPEPGRLPGAVTAMAAFRGPGNAWVVAASGGGSLQFHAPFTGVPVRIGLARFYTGTVTAMTTFGSPDRYLATGDDEGTVKIWNLANQSFVCQVAACSAAIRALAALPDPEGELLVIGGEDGKVVVADPRTRALRAPIVTNGGPIRAMTVFPGPAGTSLLATSNDGMVRLWAPLAEKHRIRSRQRDTSKIMAMAAFPGRDGRWLIATGGGDGTVRVWDPQAVRSGARTTPSPAGAETVGPVKRLAAVPTGDGRWLLASSGAGQEVHIWDPATGEHRRWLAPHADLVNAMAVLPRPDGRGWLLTGSNDRAVRAWDPVSGVATAERAGFADGWISALTAVPGRDGRWLAAVGSNRTVAIWDPDTGAVSRLPEDLGFVKSMTALPDAEGRWLLAIGTELAVRLWDPVTVERVGTAAAQAGMLTTMAAFPGPDHRWLVAIGCNDGAVRILDLIGGTPPRELCGHSGPVSALAAFPGPDGRWLLATGGGDRTVRVWDPVAEINLLTVTTGAPVHAVTACTETVDFSAQIAYGGPAGFAAFRLPNGSV
ncbi:WD40 repeat domain-containing protein [Actinospica robiniae]|uniref:WD40 repeat domain-containing protein n=1 Tax=Actinospica robiniae TaxID=304901 RepID=UPI0003FFAACC|nr:WD40 repeat domain-containing protein [Actinospica robiniae]